MLPVFQIRVQEASIRSTSSEVGISKSYEALKMPSEADISSCIFKRQNASRKASFRNNQSSTVYLDGRAAEPSLGGVLGLQKDCHSFSI